jgi:hypothetical protein
MLIRLKWPWIPQFEKPQDTRWRFEKKLINIPAIHDPRGEEPTF